MQLNARHLRKPSSNLVRAGLTLHLVETVLELGAGSLAKTLKIMETRRPMTEAALGNHDESQTLTPLLAARPAHPKWMRWAGWSMSGLMILFLLFDSLSKLGFEHHVVEATTKIGYPLDTIRPLGIICLICTALYAIPRTSILGAILLTGYLGGAIASKVRIEDPIFSSVLFGAYFGVLVWGGLYLRDERLRSLIPLRKDLGG